MLNQKRLFDLITASFALILIIPLGILVYPFLVFFIGQPIIFRQKRTGKNGRDFILYKLRSMKKNAIAAKKNYLTQNQAPYPMFKIADDPRFIQKKINFYGLNKTRTFNVGKFLSRSGIDEIPQFLNILRGEMSLIGPRPLPTQEALLLKKKDPKWYEWRHSVNPGIFSIWALDQEHNKSFSYWRELERKTIKMTPIEEIRVIFKIVQKQLKNLYQ